MSVIDDLLKLLKASDNIAADLVRAIEPVLTSPAFDNALTDAIRNADVANLDEAIEQIQKTAADAEGLTHQARNFLTGNTFKRTLEIQIHGTRFLDDGNALLAQGKAIDLDALRGTYPTVSDEVFNSLKVSVDLREETITSYAGSLVQKYPNANTDELNDYARDLWVWGQKKQTLGDEFTEAMPSAPASIADNTADAGRNADNVDAPAPEATPNAGNADEAAPNNADNARNGDNGGDVNGPAARTIDNLSDVEATNLIPEYRASRIQTAIKWTPILGKVGFNVQESMPYEVMAKRYIEPVITFVDQQINAGGLAAKINALNADLKSVGNALSRGEISMVDAQQSMAAKVRTFSTENGDDLAALRENLRGVRKELAEQKYLSIAPEEGFDPTKGVLAPHLTGLLRPQLESLRSFVDDIDDVTRSLVNPDDALQGFLVREANAADDLLNSGASFKQQASLVNTRLDNLLKIGSVSTTRMTHINPDGSKGFVEVYDRVQRAIIEGAYNENVRSTAVIKPSRMQNSENTLMLSLAEFKKLMQENNGTVDWTEPTIKKFMGQIAAFKALGQDQDAVYLIRSLQFQRGRSSIEVFPDGVKELIDGKIDAAKNAYDARFYETIKEAVNATAHNNHFLKQRHVLQIYDKLSYWPRMARRYAGDDLISYPATNRFVKDPLFRAAHESLAYVTGGRSVLSPTADNPLNRNLSYNVLWNKEYRDALPEGAGIFRKASHTIQGIPPLVALGRLGSGGIMSPLGKTLATGGLNTTTGRYIWGGALGISALSYSTEKVTGVIADNTGVDWLRGFDGEGGLGFDILNRPFPAVVRTGVGMSDLVLDDWMQVSSGAVSVMMGGAYSDGFGLDVSGIYDAYMPEFFTGDNSTPLRSGSIGSPTAMPANLDDLKDGSENNAEAAEEAYEAVRTTLSDLAAHLVAFETAQMAELDALIGTFDPASADFTKYTALKTELNGRLAQYNNEVVDAVNVLGPASLAALDAVQTQDSIIQATDAQLVATRAWTEQARHLNALAAIEAQVSVESAKMIAELDAMKAGILSNGTIPAIVLTPAERAAADAVRIAADAKAADDARIAAEAAAALALQNAADANTAAQTALAADPNNAALQAAAVKAQADFDLLNVVEIARLKAAEDARIAAAAKADADARAADAARLAALTPDQRAAEAAAVEAAARAADPLYDEHKGAAASLTEATAFSSRIGKLHGSDTATNSAAFLVAGMQTQQADKITALSEEMFDKGDHNAVTNLNELLANVNGNNRAAQDILTQLAANQASATALQTQVNDLNTQIQGITALSGKGNAQGLLATLQGKTDALKDIKEDSEALHKQIEQLVSDNSGLIQANPEAKHHFGTGGAFSRGAIAAGGGEYGLLNQFLGSEAGGSSVIGGYFNMAGSKLRDGMDWWSEAKRGARTQGEMNGYNLAEQGFLAFMSIVALNKVGEWTGMSKGVKIAALIGIVGYFIHRSGATGQAMRDNADARNPFAQINPSLRGRNNLPTNVQRNTSASTGNTNDTTVEDRVVTLRDANGNPVTHQLPSSDQRSITAQGENGGVPQNNVVDIRTAREARDTANQTVSTGQGDGSNVINFDNRSDSMRLVANGETPAGADNLITFPDMDGNDRSVDAQSMAS